MTWNIDPILFNFGGISLHWYGLLFACGIWGGAALLKRMLKESGQNVALVDELFFPVFIGIIVGARLMHCLAYEPDFYLAHPMEILYIWKGGLASHGGGLGAILGVLWVARRNKLSLMYLLDYLALPTLVFAVCVRLANLMNSEIYGKVTDGPWGVIFARVDMLPRHPAQLYEAMGYLLLAVLLWQMRRALLALEGRLFGAFLIGVFVIRMLVEVVKPEQASYIPSLPLTVGQLLSVPFILVGIWLWLRARTGKRS
ncbi:prolipoprotein diacylglyceryl transferase [Shewanella zhangzhouensis]|uniref:prolipoprotein diacylglyceryl transferase n=1 Tax=Shewanella zhangzhouensis TaxID=2864213 RepID=UPI001C65EDAC|nr:prolipoprotein diacylglyceryl transferase [Shewanella zhangzhouensis]QYK05547.1 prolipoprotein diacylglyceryl transferase [Shewanella zhangzhouensis]